MATLDEWLLTQDNDGGFSRFVPMPPDNPWDRVMVAIFILLIIAEILVVIL